MRLFFLSLPVLFIKEKKECCFAMPLMLPQRASLHFSVTAVIKVPNCSSLYSCNVSKVQTSLFFNVVKDNWLPSLYCSSCLQHETIVFWCVYVVQEPPTQFSEFLCVAEWPFTRFGAVSTTKETKCPSAVMPCAW